MPWAAVTLACAIAATLLDSMLLQRRRTFFTGGFLAVDHVTSATQAVGFLATSLAVDFAVLGAVAFLVLWACGRAGAGRRTSITLAAIASLGPIVVADFIQYQLLTYLGDAFDLRLMFTLTGRSTGELLAVASDHLLIVSGFVAAVLCVAAAAVWLFRARAGAPIMPVTTPSLRQGVIVCSVLLLMAGGLTAVVRSSSDVLDNGLRRKPAGQILGAAVIAATDVDRDGFGILGRPPDPDLFDARIQPYALEIPGNGVDENGLAGDLPADAEPYVEKVPAAAPWRSRPDVVLIVLESFRADAVGAVVHGQPVTPVLTALASQGVHVPQAYSHNGYTVQSRHHMLSGSLAGFDTGSLVDDFRAHGYQTAYFSAQDDSFGGSKGTIGFEGAEIAYDARTDSGRRYTTFTTAGSLAVPHTVLSQRVDEFLQARNTDRPLFLYVNFHDTHFPYHHRGIRPLVSDVVVRQGGIRPDAAADVREMYLNTAANVDRAIGELLEGVRRSVDRDPAVIVLSDHGESLFDESFLGHGYALNDAQTRIPLIVANLPLVIEEPFGQSDLRGLLRRALEGSSDMAAPPTVIRSETKKVFQYLGMLDRPAEIAFVTSAGRITYDMRERKFRSGSGPWRPPGDLEGAERQQFLDLVHTWERMMLARR